MTNDQMTEADAKEMLRESARDFFRLQRQLAGAAEVFEDLMRDDRCPADRALPVMREVFDIAGRLGIMPTFDERPGVIMRLVEERLRTFIGSRLSDLELDYMEIDLYAALRARYPNSGARISRGFDRRGGWLLQIEVIFPDQRFACQAYLNGWA